MIFPICFIKHFPHGPGSTTPPTLTRIIVIRTVSLHPESLIKQGNPLPPHPLTTCPIGGDTAAAFSDIDTTYAYYYDGQRQIEVRNGSDEVRNQQVWGLGYIKERYKYTPYGKRQTYYSAGSNDPLALTPRYMSQRVVTDTETAPYALNEFGRV